MHLATLPYVINWLCFCNSTIAELNDIFSVVAFHKDGPFWLLLFQLAPTYVTKFIRSKDAGLWSLPTMYRKFNEQFLMDDIFFGNKISLELRKIDGGKGPSKYVI